MASAWFTASSTLYNNNNLLAGIIKAIDWWIANDYTNEDCSLYATIGYNKTTCPCSTPGLWVENFWFNVIDVPTIFAEVCVLLQAGQVPLTATEIAGYFAFPMQSHNEVTKLKYLFFLRCERILGRARPNSLLTSANAEWTCAVWVQDGLFSSNDTDVVEAYARANQVLCLNFRF